MLEKKDTSSGLPSGGERIFYASYSSELGDIYALASKEGLLATGLAQKEDDFVLKAEEECGRGPEKRPAEFCELFSLLDDYFIGQKVDFVLDLKLVGSPFELSVWRALRGIPYAQCRGYGWVAQNAEGISPRAYRAVGRACGANRLPIIIPCHRVISSSGSIGGFAGDAGGVQMKRRLLAIEGVIL